MTMDLPTDIKCSACGRWAAQHGDLTICPKTENEILRIELGRLQRSVLYLFTLQDSKQPQEFH